MGSTVRSGIKMASDTLKIVTHEDAVLAKKPPLRVGEQVPADDEEPDKLMELLGDIDGLKQEIHDRMRRLEAVKQARSLLREDALRTEALNKRLAEFGKVMSAVNSPMIAPAKEQENAESSRMQTRDPHADPEPRHAAVRVMGDGGSLSRVQSETTGNGFGNDRNHSGGPSLEFSDGSEANAPL